MHILASPILLPHALSPRDAFWCGTGYWQCREDPGYQLLNFRSKNELAILLVVDFEV